MTHTVLRGLAIGACALVLAGCGSQTPAARSEGGASRTDGSSATGMHRMSDGTEMSDAEMSDPEMHGAEMHGAEGHHAAGDEATSAPGQVTHREHGPSEPAAMICSREIAESVQRTFALAALPEAVDAWSASARLYSCSYDVGTSRLRLSVKDLDAAAPGKAYFAAQRTELRARPIRGLQNLGFPALQTRRDAGNVVFLKDHKTLRVDAAEVAQADLPPGFSRTGAAYGVAASVIACWTE